MSGILVQIGFSLSVTFCTTTPLPPVYSRLRLKPAYIKDWVNLLYITLQHIPFCCYLGGYPSMASTIVLGRQFCNV